MGKGNATSRRSSTRWSRRPTAPSARLDLSLLAAGALLTASAVVGLLHRFLAVGRHVRRLMLGLGVGEVGPDELAHGPVGPAAPSAQA